MVRRLDAALLVFIGTAAMGSAQPPAIFPNGVTNAASRMPPPLPGGGIAPGSRVIIQGIRFASPTVTIGGLPARVIGATDARIEAVVPEDARVGDADVRVSGASGRSEAFRVRVVPTSVGISNVDSEGGGRFRINGTGLGADRHPAVLIAGRYNAGVIAAGPKTGDPGMDEITFQLPDAARDYCRIPVQVNAGGVTSNTFIVRARPDCVDGGWPVPDSNALQRLGAVILLRASVEVEANGGQLVEFIDEEGAALFLDRTAGQTNALESPPPVGGCATYEGFFYPSSESRSMAAQLSSGLEAVHLLDAGREIRIAGAKATQTLPQLRGRPKVYGAPLGGESPEYGMRTLPLFLNPGRYAVASSGGGDVGAFNLPLDADQSFTWTNRRKLVSIDRKAGAMVTWRGNPASRGMVILALNADEDSGAFGLAFCRARPGETKFDIPAAALANIPATRPGALPTSLVVLVSVPHSAARATARGLDTLLGGVVHASIRSVTFQ